MDLAVSTQVSPEMEKRLAGIKLIALDLDGTTLTREGLTRRTKDTLEEAIEQGIDVVIATGRVFSALPEKIPTAVTAAAVSAASNISKSRLRIKTSPPRDILCPGEGMYSCPIHCPPWRYL